MSFLQATGLTKTFGGLRAVDRLDFSVERGEILGLIGPNGSGKSTAMSLVMGLHRPDAGSVLLDGTDVAGWSPNRIAERGVSMVFQHSRPLQQQTVLQNVLIACLPNRLRNLRVSSTQRERAIDALRLVGLEDVQDKWPSELPFAGLRRLELAKALARDPQLLLLDEPFAGLSASEVREFSELIRNLRSAGRALILVDHNVRSVRALVDRAVAMSSGQKIAEGHPDAVLADENVRRVYLGGEGSHATGESSRVEASGVPILQVSHLNVSYGKARALSDVSIDVVDKGVTAVVGLNGAGKTSLFNAITGFAACEGDITYAGKSIKGMPAHEIARSGIVLCPETRELFGDMSVLENLNVGGMHLSAADKKERLAFVEQIFPRLGERRAQFARTLSGGEQQQLAIGRALMMKPRLLLIDEPTLGLAPIVMDVISQSIEALRQSKELSLLIAEQNMTFASRHADRIYLIEHGTIEWAGGADRFAAEAGARIL
jgi:branched-chain amino acid transport system ATP-binding protein